MYSPPGVFISNATTANYSANAVIPSSVGIFGRAVSALTFTENIDIPADASGVAVASNVLSRPNVSNVSIKLVPTNDVLDSGTDYTLTEVTEEDGNKYTTIKRVLTSELLVAGGSTVTVTYNYTLLNYYKAFRFTDQIDINTFYGAPFDSAGNVQSELSLAAQLAFANGATTVICSAVREETEAAYLEALALLTSARDVSIVVCANGNQAYVSAVSQAVRTASNNELERRAILGVDGSSVAIDADAIAALAARTANKRVAIVAPPSVDYNIASMNKTVKIGGQFLAAAAAGLASSLNVQEPLTRKVMTGIPSIGAEYDTSTKNNLAASGVMVIEQTTQGSVRIRHGVTTDATSKNSSEWSVVGATDYVISSIRSMLDTSGFIGSAITPNTVPTITGMIDALLTSAISDSVISSYDSLSVMQRTTEPDVIDIRFAISFLFPLNKIYVTLTSSAASGSTDVSVEG